MDVSLGVVVGVSVTVAVGAVRSIVVIAIGVVVAIAKSHQTRGGACVGSGVFVAVPVLRAIAVPVAAHASGVTGNGVTDGVGEGVKCQQ